jgi:hypothetical protein
MMKSWRNIDIHFVWGDAILTYHRQRVVRVDPATGREYVYMRMRSGRYKRFDLDGPTDLVFTRNSTSTSPV